MPLFFYNLRSGDILAEGTVGVHSPDLESARTKAKVAARHVLSQRIALRVPIEGQVFEVTDDEGYMLFSVNLRDVMHS
ncbi:DUF6894 family protein [Pararhizobium sp. PWRC1-1]|uniref:DUF6894 family protein n=1 Tax=Pararhizobium sp. PWRC1-1 TaxID=2804566 RepID=UPI003CF16C31